MRVHAMKTDPRYLLVNLYQTLALPVQKQEVVRKQEPLGNHDITRILLLSLHLCEMGFGMFNFLL